MADERCENCRFWLEVNDVGLLDGDCRRYPPELPHMVSQMATIEDDGEDLPFPIDGVFPQTSFSDWCGEFQLKGDTRPPVLQDAIQVIDQLDPEAISEQLRELDRQSSALRVLLRSARSRQNGRRSKEKSDSPASV